MHPAFSSDFRATPAGREAESILRKCVHCGFCTAHCPTYQLLGDELDSPRGRIYLIKAMLEGEQAGTITQRHLDRCLTCRACETVCPSGVEYGRLLDIGRERLEQVAPRTALERWRRRLLIAALTHRPLFSAALRLARRLRPLMPKRLQARVPRRRVPVPRPAGASGTPVILLRGCVQPELAPTTNAAAARLLARLGYAAVEVDGEGCCGALPYHLSDVERARAMARANIDAWWSAIESGAAAIVSAASGCGVMLEDYARLLGDDPDYADKAARVVELAADLVELAAGADRGQLRPAAGVEQKIAFQSPCTLQHGQRLTGRVERLLTDLGFELTPVPEPHLCCGSAGTYSLLQPDLSQRLRARKLERLLAGEPQLIATANIGCQLHLEAVSPVPVRHWAELVE